MQRVNNLEVRQAIAKKRLRFCEVAAALNVHPVTFSRWLQLELTPERKQEIIKVIEGIEV
jgi:sulfur carrier protein ThiS